MSMRDWRLDPILNCEAMASTPESRDEDDHHNPLAHGVSMLETADESWAVFGSGHAVVMVPVDKNFSWDPISPWLRYGARGVDDAEGRIRAAAFGAPTHSADAAQFLLWLGGPAPQRIKYWDGGCDCERAPPCTSCDGIESAADAPWCEDCYGSGSGDCPECSVPYEPPVQAIFGIGGVFDKRLIRAACGRQLSGNLLFVVGCAWDDLLGIVGDGWRAVIAPMRRLERWPLEVAPTHPVNANQRQRTLTNANRHGRRK